MHSKLPLGTIRVHMSSHGQSNSVHVVSGFRTRTAKMDLRSQHHTMARVHVWRVMTSCGICGTSVASVRSFCRVGVKMKVRNTQACRGKRKRDSLTGTDMDGEDSLARWQAP